MFHFGVFNALKLEFSDPVFSVGGSFTDLKMCLTNICSHGMFQAFFFLDFIIGSLNLVLYRLSVLITVWVTDGRPWPAETGRAGLPHPRPAVSRPGGIQRTPWVLLFSKPIRYPQLCEETLQPGKPLPNAAGQHRFWGLHTSCVLWEQLQTGNWNKVRRDYLHLFMHKHPWQDQ